MNARTIQPLAAAGIAAVLTAATITTVGIQSTNARPALRTEFAAVQLQALAVSAVPAAAVAPTVAVTPSAAATAAAAIDPAQIVTDFVKNAVSVAATVLWYAAFPITLPLSVIGGLVASVAQTVSNPKAVTAAELLQGINFFFTAPNILLTTGFANIGLAATFTQQQMLHFPIGMAGAVRSAAATKRAATAPAAPAASSARSAKKSAAAAHAAPAAAKRASAGRSAR